MESKEMASAKSSMNLYADLCGVCWKKPSSSGEPAKFWGYLFA